MTENNKIYRITIDERLAEDLIRVVLAKHKGPIKESTFDDSIDSWNDEDYQVVDHKEWVKEFSITDENNSKFPFSSLYEGQVLLCGNCDLIYEEKNKCKFRLQKSKSFNLFDITSFVKEEVKAMYTKALTGDKNHG